MYHEFQSSPVTKDGRYSVASERRALCAFQSSPVTKDGRYIADDRLARPTRTVSILARH
jgi:hypothetical protein